MGGKKETKERRMTLFTVRVAEYQNSVPKQVVESPSLDIFKPQLDMALSNLLYLTLLCAAGSD